MGKIHASHLYTLNDSFLFWVCRVSSNKNIQKANQSGLETDENYNKTIDGMNKRKGAIETKLLTFKQKLINFAIEK